MLKVCLLLPLGISAAQTGQNNKNKGQPTIDCTQFFDCMNCSNNHCFWAQNGTCMTLGNQQILPCPQPPQQQPVAKKGTCSPACKFNQICQNGKCTDKSPKEQPRPGDCLMQPTSGSNDNKSGKGKNANGKGKNGKSGKTQSGASGDQDQGELPVPFIKDGDRYQNPMTCDTLFCHNGTLGMLHCPTTICSNGDQKHCDPSFKCLPQPCTAPAPISFDCAASGSIPWIKQGASYRDPQTCITYFCNNGLVGTQQCALSLCADGTTKQCDPHNNCQPALCTPAPPVASGPPAAPVGCLMQNGYPPLASGATWRDPITCNTFTCNNGVRVQTYCLSVTCADGSVKPCDPTNDCKPRDCSPDCLATGSMPFLRNMQNYFDPNTCDTYTCLNKVATRESCMVGICANGEVRPCDPTNRCLPMACPAGTVLLIPPTIPGLVWPPLTLTTPILPLVFGGHDCPALGKVPLLRHGGRFTDMSTCNLYTCTNGVSTSESACLMNVCPGGVLAGCDPANGCRPKPCIIATVTVG